MYNLDLWILLNFPWDLYHIFLYFPPGFSEKVALMFWYLIKTIHDRANICQFLVPK